MASIAGQLADAVTAALNAHDFGQAFTAARTWMPDLERKDIATLTVTVVPRLRENLAAATRAQNQSEYIIDIGLQKSVKPSDNAAVDALVELGEEIAAHFARLALTDYPAARILRVAQDPLADPEHLRTQRQYTGIVSLTYLVVA